MHDQHAQARNSSPRAGRRHGGAVFQGALLGVLGVAVVGSTIAVGQRSSYRFFDRLIDVEQSIESMYVDEVDPEELQRGAIKGMLDVLDDEYALYVPPSLSEEFNTELTGQFVGIGAYVGVRDGALTIVNPLDGSPALEAGLLAGDRILEIAGSSAEGLSTSEGIELIKGPPGTKVVLKIERDGAELELEVGRANIQAPSVRGFHRGSDDGWRYALDRANGIAYVRLLQFRPGCENEVAEALGNAARELGRDGPADLGGLVLDLRGNPGGGLTEAIALSDLFLTGGPIVTTRGRAFPERTADATPQRIGDFPVAVLIDSQSASASEIVSGSLQENGRAIVLGERSFGKGSVQTVRAFEPSGAQLKITTQRYYLPSGRSIQRMPGETVWGVDPSPGFYVGMSDDEFAAASAVSSREALIDGGAVSEDEAAVDFGDAEAVLEYLSDPQLAAGVRAVATRIETGDWQPISEESVEGGELATEELASLIASRDRLARQIGRLDDRIGELAAIASGQIAQDQRDLWPDETETQGGRLEVYGPGGERVTTLAIDGSTLERWLIDAPVSPADTSPADEETE